MWCCVGCWILAWAWADVWKIDFFEISKTVLEHLEDQNPYKMCPEQTLNAISVLQTP